MSRGLDEELEKAIGEDEEPSSTPGVVKSAAGPMGPPPAAKRRNLGLLIALLAMAGALVALFMVGFKEAAVYAISVKDLHAQAAELDGRKVRVEGELVPGTLKKRDDPCEFRFTMEAEDEELSVVYPQCVIPDTFRDRPEGGVQVTVEGALTDGVFEADLVMAKCTSKYDPESRSLVVEDKPKAAPAADEPIY